MTLTEAENFLNTEIKGLWPDWEPTDAETRLWIKELKKADYAPTKSALDKWYVAQKHPKKRPILGQVRHLFLKIISYEERQAMEEPVLVYEIVNEKNIVKRTLRHPVTDEVIKEYMSHCGQGFCVANRNKLPADPEIVEREAERMRQKFNEFYGGNHIVYRHWEKYYE